MSTVIIITVKKCSEHKLGGKGVTIKMCDVTLNNNGLLPISDETTERLSHAKGQIEKIK